MILFLLPFVLQVSYSLVNDFGVFGIDNKTGSMFIKKQLDREEISVYKIQVKARDHGANQLSSLALVSRKQNTVKQYSKTNSKIGHIALVTHIH
jgi:hypothetical protein